MTLKTTLKEQIKKDLNVYLKEGNQIACSALRMLLASILNKEKEKQYNLSKTKQDFLAEDLKKESQLTDEEVMDTIRSEAKKRKEAIAGFEQGGRKESADKERQELEVLQKYLPAQMSEEEIRKIVKETIEKSKASSLKEIGKVMVIVMPQLKGKADGAIINKIVKELLL